MDRLFKSVLSVRELKFRMDDDYVDRLSRQQTVILLICFCFIVSTKQFVGQPINCWCPAQFTDSHREYSDAICWVSNTYYLPIEQTIPGEPFDTTAKNRRMISYYQWVPLILLFQVIHVSMLSLFCLAKPSSIPQPVWDYLSDYRICLDVLILSVYYGADALNNIQNALGCKPHSQEEQIISKNCLQQTSDPHNRCWWELTAVEFFSLRGTAAHLTLCCFRSAR